MKKEYCVVSPDVKIDAILALGWGHCDVCVSVACWNQFLVTNCPLHQSSACPHFTFAARSKDILSGAVSDCNADWQHGTRWR